ncbi:MAG: methyltransferase domain-containing protein [Actinomycetota bacterium]
MATTPAIETELYDARYDPDEDFDVLYTDLTAELIVRRVDSGDRVLELGCAGGRMTAALAAAGATVTGVDRSSTYLERARARALPGVELRRDEIVGYDDGSRYDHVVITSVLHEVPDPRGLMATCARSVRTGGLVHVSAPNPHSLHRLLAVRMGLIDELGELSATSRDLGHVGHVDRAGIEELGRSVGLEAVDHHPIMFKPFPNADLARLEPDLIRALAEVAEVFPEHGAMNLVVLRRVG